MAAPTIFQTGVQVLKSLVGLTQISADQGGPVSAVLQFHGGTVVLNEATPVTVADAYVNAGSLIVFTLKTVGGTLVAGQGPNVMTITPGTGFTVAGASTDTSTYNYLVIG